MSKMNNHKVHVRSWLNDKAGVKLVNIADFVHFSYDKSKSFESLDKKIRDSIKV